MGSTIRAADTQHWVGKAQSPSNVRWLKRALGAERKRDRSNLVPSMSRRGNCWDNAVVESFFNLLKRERIRRKKYKTREVSRRDVFDYIEFFYNPQPTTQTR